MTNDGSFSSSSSCSFLFLFSCSSFWGGYILLGLSLSLLCNITWRPCVIAFMQNKRLIWPFFWLVSRLCLNTM